MTEVANTPDRRYTASRKIGDVHFAITLPIRWHSYAPIETTQWEWSDIRIVLRHAIERDVVNTAMILAIPFDQAGVSILV
jgi:hypothetical protein